MIQSNTYSISEHEAEKASNSYLMSLLAVIVGLPLPIINLIATLIFYLGNRKGTRFVRWHCTQALLSQASLFFVNTVGFWWTVSIVFAENTVSNLYISYIITAIVFNLIELGATIHAAIRTRNGQHVSWWFFGELTDSIVKR
jgi:uncharacterized Tic20 family protein